MPRETSLLGDIGANSGIPFGGVIGNVASGVISTVGGWLGGGGTPMGDARAFDGLHSPTLPNLDPTTMKAPEAGILVAYARGLGISVEEVDAMMQADARRNRGGDMSYIVNAWRVTDLNNARIQMRAYNQENPLNNIHEGELGPRSAYGSNYAPTTGAVPVTVNTSPASPASSNPLVAATNGVFTLPTVPAIGSNGFLGGLFGGGSTPAPTTGPTAAEIAKAALDAAIAAATDKALQTPAGMNAKAAGFKSFLKDNQLIIAGVITLLVGAFTWAFTRKR